MQGCPALKVSLCAWSRVEDVSVTKQPSETNNVTCREGREKEISFPGNHIPFSWDHIWSESGPDVEGPACLGLNRLLLLLLLPCALMLAQRSLEEDSGASTRLSFSQHLSWDAVSADGALGEDSESRFFKEQPHVCITGVLS